MTQPVRQNLFAERGDTTAWTITFTQPLSAFVEIWFTVRDGYAEEQADDADAVSQLKLSNGGITPTGADTASAEFSSAQTSAWSAEMQLTYDVQVRTTTGKIYTTQIGFIQLGPDVTRSTAAP